MAATLTQSVLDAFQKAKDSQSEARLRDGKYKNAVSTRESAQADEAKALEDRTAAQQTAHTDALSAIDALKADLEEA